MERSLTVNGSSWKGFLLEGLTGRSYRKEVKIEEGSS